MYSMFEQEEGDVVVSWVLTSRRDTLCALNLQPLWHLLQDRCFQYPVLEEEGTQEAHTVPKDLSIQLKIDGRRRSIFLCGEAMGNMSMLQSTRPHPRFCSNPNWTSWFTKAKTTITRITIWRHKTQREEEEELGGAEGWMPVGRGTREDDTDGSSVRSTWCSGRRSEFAFRHPYLPAHICL